MPKLSNENALVSIASYLYTPDNNFMHHRPVTENVIAFLVHVHNECRNIFITASSWILSILTVTNWIEMHRITWNIHIYGCFTRVYSSRESIINSLILINVLRFKRSCFECPCLISFTSKITVSNFYPTT